MSNWDAAYRSGDYLSHWDYRVPSQELVATVAALSLPAASVALDIGCGAGREAIFLARCGFRVYGVDSSEAAIRIAKKRAKEAGVLVEWHCADVARMPLPDQSVDFVNDRGCFHVIAEKRRPKVALELWRVMKPGARMLLRGSCRRGREGFVPVTQNTVAEFFKKPYFSRGPIVPIILVANTGTLSANLVVLTRR